VTLTCLILTFNEEVHIARAIGSVLGVADRIVVVDSGSTDRTCEIALSMGARVLQHPWSNHAAQFNWGLDQLGDDTGWVLRLDADEIVTAALASEIAARLPSLDAALAGVYIPRRMTFMRRPIRHGGVFPVMILRLLRHGRGRCENRWMDEHILVDGPTERFAGEILDDSLKSLSWWTEKHNGYASREAIELLNLEHGFLPRDPATLRPAGQPGVKRWLKERAYARLPAGPRAIAYFLYRYILRLGFLDGREGLAFHLLQGLWYRFLVDAKLREVKAAMVEGALGPVEAIRQVFGIDVAPGGPSAPVRDSHATRRPAARIMKRSFG
jgi:glycosyltransferase involved in cell wall biosynthesis